MFLLAQAVRSSLACLVRSERVKLAGAAPREAGTSWTSSVRLSGIHVNALVMTELTVMFFRLRILPVAASPTQSSTRFAVPFRKAKCFPSSLHSTPLIFAPGGTSIFTSEPSATPSELTRLNTGNGVVSLLLG